MGKIRKTSQATEEATDSKIIYITPAYQAEKPILEIAKHEDFSLAGGDRLKSLSVANLFYCVTPRELQGYWKKGKAYADTDGDGRATAKEGTEYLKDYEGKVIKRESPYSGHNFDFLSTPSLTPSNSNKAFVLRYLDPESKGKGKIQVQVRSFDSENPHSVYQDKVKIDLYELAKDGGYVSINGGEGTGIFVSGPSILVSNKIADAHAEDKRSLENSVNDRTFLAIPGNTIEVSYTNDIGETLTTQTQVPILYELWIQPIVPRDKNGNPVVTQQEVDRQIARLQEDYAAAGIKVRASYTQFINLHSKYDPNHPFQDQEEMFQAIQRIKNELAPRLYDPENKKLTLLEDSYDDKEIKMVFWNAEKLSQEKSKVVGYAWSKVQPESKYWRARNTFLVSVKNGVVVNNNVATHEVGHLLLKDRAKAVSGHDKQDSPHYHTSGLDHEKRESFGANHHFDLLKPEDKLNVMYYQLSFLSNTIDERRYFSDEQIHAMQRSPLLHPPKKNLLQETFAAPTAKPEMNLFQLKP